jgi:hypothetical protein
MLFFPPQKNHLKFAKRVALAFLVSLYGSEYLFEVTNDESIPEFYIKKLVSDEGSNWLGQWWGSLLTA